MFELKSVIHAFTTQLKQKLKTNYPIDIVKVDTHNYEAYFVVCTIKPLSFVEKEKKLQIMISEYNKEDYVKMRDTLIRIFIETIESYERVIMEEIEKEMSLYEEEREDNVYLNSGGRINA